ncbi:uncharacterized protein YjiS (DUF1127 family) [Bradyrhizobium sp. USDA 4448]
MADDRRDARIRDAVRRERHVSVLGQLTDRDLKELGVWLGDRRKLLANIAELSASGASPMATAPAPRGDGRY